MHRIQQSKDDRAMLIALFGAQTLKTVDYFKAQVVGAQEPSNWLLKEHKWSSLF